MTEQHLKLPSKVTHSIYFSSNLCMNFPERHPKATFNCPSNDPHTHQVMSCTIFSELFVAWELFRRYKLYKFITLAAELDAYTDCCSWREFLTNCPLRNSSLLSRSSLGFLSFSFFFFFLCEQVLVITCNRLWRGYRICQTSLAIKSRGRSFGILPLRISCVSILLGALSMLCCLPSSSPKFHLSNGVLAVSSFSLPLIKG